MPNTTGSCWTERKRQTDEGYASGPGPLNSGSPDAQYQRDRARIIHCAAFRRLQSKTQVLSLGESDFYRTRLTHSLKSPEIRRIILKSFFLPILKEFAKFREVE